jgi:hypothetical protein
MEKKYNKIYFFYYICLVKNSIIIFVMTIVSRKKYIPVKYWTKELILNDVKKNNYKNKSDFSQRNNSAFIAARINGWLDEILQFTGKKNIALVQWTKEKTAIEAAKYPNKSAFFRSNFAAYSVALANEWLSEFYPKKFK